MATERFELSILTYASYSCCQVAKSATLTPPNLLNFMAQELDNYIVFNRVLVQNLLYLLEFVTYKIFWP